MYIFTLSNEQTKKINKNFGKDFVQSLPEKLAIYIKKWRLNNFSLIEYYSNNCLLMCESSRYGECVIKIFPSGYEYYINEARSLAEVSGKCGYVKVYEYDEEHSVLLLERISPGTMLKNEKSIDVRISKFVDVWQNAHITPNKPEAFESWLDVVEQTANNVYLKNNNDILKQTAEQMVSVCKELYDLYPEKLLLHSDLHGENLLKNKNGDYTIVDPHGRIGPKVYDLGRFISNEHNNAAKDNRTNLVKHIVSQISMNAEIPYVNVVRAFFADIALLTCWNAEYGSIEMDGVILAESILNN